MTYVATNFGGYLSMSCRVSQIAESHPVKGRILLVEDEAILAELTRRLLVEWGHDVIGILNKAEDAIRQAALLRPDLIIMDIRLAGSMDGLEAALCIAAATPVAVLFTTGYDQTVADAVIAQISAPCLSLSKPVPPQRLAEAVQTLLQGALSSPR